MPLAPADGAQASRAGAISNGPVPGASTAWGSRSLRWVIGSAAALLVLAAGVGAGVLWLNLHGNDPGERPRVVSESSAPVRTPVPAPSASASAASSSGSASAEPAPIEFTCWNGASVLDLRECASPRTEAEAYAYLQYVYPELAGIVASCEPKKGASKYSDIAVYFNCPGDGVTTIRYRYWRNLADAEGHYADDAKKFDGAHPYDVFIGEQRVNGWVRAYNIPENGLLTVTMFIPDQHLSLSIEGKSTDAIWAAFERTTIRPVEETLGHRSGQEASVSVLGRR